MNTLCQKCKKKSKTFCKALYFNRLKRIWECINCTPYLNDK